ncbi:MAG: hypothetical protein O7G88_16805 [bacterium]|nr:hypothetical protein [bacterium]
MTLTMIAYDNQLKLKSVSPQKGVAMRCQAWNKSIGCRLGVLVGLVAVFLGCAKPHIAYQAPTPPACQKPEQAVVYKEFPLHHFLPLPLGEIEEKFLLQPFDILAAKATSGGSTSAVQLKIQYRDCTVVKIKWRASPRDARRYNNDPRREIASYRFQKLFLEPDDYVVPVTESICIPSVDLMHIGLNLTPQLPEIKCVFGPAAIWLRNVEVVGNFLDRERFERSATGQEERGYARAFANLNIFTYLISHRDGRKGNFLVSRVARTPHIFSIDNSLAYAGIGNPRPFIPHWSRLKVDKLPRETVARLRAISSNALYRQLGVVAEAHVTADGEVKRAASFSPNLNPHKGYRRQDHVRQIGLTNREISKIENRLLKLLQRVDSGEIQLF